MFGRPGAASGSVEQSVPMEPKRTKRSRRLSAPAISFRGAASPLALQTVGLGTSPLMSPVFSPLAAGGAAAAAAAAGHPSSSSFKPQHSTRRSVSASRMALPTIRGSPHKAEDGEDEDEDEDEEEEEEEAEEQEAASADVDGFNENMEVLETAVRQLRALRSSADFGMGADKGKRVAARARQLLAVARLSLDVTEMLMLPEARTVHLSLSGDTKVLASPTHAKRNKRRGISGAKSASRGELRERVMAAIQEEEERRAKLSKPRHPQRAMSFSARGERVEQWTSTVNQVQTLQAKQKQEEEEEKVRLQQRWLSSILNRTGPEVGAPRVAYSSSISLKMWDYYRALLSLEPDSRSIPHPYALTIKSFVGQASTHLLTTFQHFSTLLTQSAESSAMASPQVSSPPSVQAGSLPLISSSLTGRTASGDSPSFDPLHNAGNGVLLTPTSPLSTHTPGGGGDGGARGAERSSRLSGGLKEALKQVEQDIKAFVANHARFVWQSTALVFKHHELGSLGQSVCTQAVEHAVLSQLHAPLTACYSLLSLEKDLLLKEAMEAMKSKGPEHFFVPKFLRLDSPVKPGASASRGQAAAKEVAPASPAATAAAATAAAIVSSGSSSPLSKQPVGSPYERVWKILAALRDSRTWREKCEVLVCACQAIPECVAEFYQNIVDHSELSVTSDELIPLLSYCLTQSGVERLGSHLHMMRSWIDNNASMGEAGYCLATFQCSLDFVEDLYGKSGDDKVVKPQNSDLQRSYRSLTEQLARDNSLEAHVPLAPSSLMAHASLRTQPDVFGTSVADVVGAEQIDRLPLDDVDFRLSVLEDKRQKRVAEVKGPMASSPTGVASAFLEKKEKTEATDIYDRLADESVANLLNVMKNKDLWSFEKTTDGVDIYRRKEELNSGGVGDFLGNLFGGRSVGRSGGTSGAGGALDRGSGIQCVMGRGTIKASPLDLTQIMREASNRPHYDTMCIDTRLVQRISENTSVAHLLFAGKHWCKTSFRDFCVLLHWRKLQDGRYVITGRSVRHKLCPEDATGKFVRGRILFSGWVLDPIRTDAASGEARPSPPTEAKVDEDPEVPVARAEDEPEPVWTRATYVVQCDVGGIAPTWVKNLIAVKQPMIIRDLREFFPNA